MAVHRKRWTCGMCQQSVPTLESMKGHIRTAHGDQVPDDWVDDVADNFGRSASHFDAADCPFCDYPTILRQRGIQEQEISRVPANRFGRHLARHLEQAALFVLPSSDLTITYEDSDDEGQDDAQEDKNAGPRQSECQLDPEVLKERLRGILALQKYNIYPETFHGRPSLALKWQIPDNLPPDLDHFDLNSPQDFPVRQGPRYKGDLYTPSWVRGNGKANEGLCTRCPVPHWVNMADGGYAFHLTYIHGIPESGIPLPRPRILHRLPYQRRVIWTALCDACGVWVVLKKTQRGWNWYRHWLNVSNMGTFL